MQRKQIAIACNDGIGPAIEGNLRELFSYFIRNVHHGMVAQPLEICLSNPDLPNRTTRDGRGMLSALTTSGSSLSVRDNALMRTLQPTWYPFVDQPQADSCWSLSAGPDGRIYAAACCEGAPGGTVEVVRYDKENDRLETLLNVAEEVDDPGDSGRGTQCKIHYSFAPSADDGVMYMATHLSGPPIDRLVYSPWHSWSDPERCFRGAALLAYDTRRDEVLWWDTLIPKEGCRCLAYDAGRRRLYALGYPRDHLWVYDIDKRERRDLGRIGSINAQVVMLDGRGRVWTTSDYGRMMRYDPETDRIETSPYRLPHNPEFQNGWHSVLYDAVMAPEGDCFYGVTWIANPRLFRIWWQEGAWGRIEDLGPMTQDRPTRFPMDTFVDHCGGLSFAPDGKLYGVSSRWESERVRDALSSSDAAESKRILEGVVWRMDPATCVREEVALLERPEGPANYVSRTGIDANGDLFFGLVNHHYRPNGIFRMELPSEVKQGGVKVPLRVWG